MQSALMMDTPRNDAEQGAAVNAAFASQLQSDVWDGGITELFRWAAGRRCW
jgi:hypothetical protein